jgi:hypothetical protein
MWKADPDQSWFIREWSWARRFARVLGVLIDDDVDKIAASSRRLMPSW